MRDVLLGVDGGGSKTRALLAARDGRILGIGSAGSSNYHAVGIEQALAAVGQALAAAGRDAGIGEKPDVAAACFGLAGVDRAIDKAALTEGLTARAIAGRIEVVNDVELVLAAGTDAGWGVALIGGTGSIGFGKSPDGRTARAGGWGAVLGDEGSGYSIATQALKLATQTADGRANAPAILGAVLAHWNLEEPEQLLSALYRPGITISEISAVTARILPLADLGDPPTLELVERAAASLADLIDAVATTLALDHPPLAMAGGVLRANPAMRAAVFRHVVTPLGPHCVVDDPAEGAVAIARRLAGD